MFRDLVGRRRMLIVLDDAMSEAQVASLLPVMPVRGDRDEPPPSDRPAVPRVGSVPSTGRSIRLLRIVGADRISRAAKVQGFAHCVVTFL